MESTNYFQKAHSSYKMGRPLMGAEIVFGPVWDPTEGKHHHLKWAPNTHAERLPRSTCQQGTPPFRTPHSTQKRSTLISGNS